MHNVLHALSHLILSVTPWKCLLVSCGHWDTSPQISLKNTSVFSHASGNWKSKINLRAKIKGSVGLVPFGGFHWLLTFLGLWPHHSNFQCQCIQISLSLPSPSSYFFLHCASVKSTPASMRILMMALMTYPDHPGSSPPLKILNVITSAKSLFPNKLKLAGSRD